ncbi:CLUMA_CG014509, isoform A, partial [Clunio marinus]
MDELRRKSSLNAPPNISQTITNPPLQRHQSLSEAERTYIFTSNVSEGQPNVGLLPSAVRIGSGHSRSISHGGGSVGGPLRPSLKSAMKGGHQRALSQGQIHDPPRSGHTRVGSKTDFILPPTHKDPDENLDSNATSALSGR